MNDQPSEVSYWSLDLALVGLLISIMIAVMAWRFDFAAVPHDMGTIGHSAERVLQGELPHADFDDPYTGLLSFVNAAGFHLFGISVLSARLMLAFCTICAFVGLYAVCRCILDPWAATATTGVAFLAAVPNYFAPMPTWYNLFCLIAMIGALLRFAATEHRRWLVVAGAIAGLSFLFKSVGLYSVATAAMFVVFHEQRRTDFESSSARESPPSSTLFAYVVIAGLTVFAGCVLVLFAAHPAFPELVTFAAPSLVLVAHLCGNEYRLRHEGSRERLARLLVHGAFFAASFAVVVALFLIPYLQSGKVSAWYEGVFERPLRRLSDESMGRPLDGGPFVLSCIVLLVIAACVAAALKEPGTRRAAAVVVVFLGLSMLIAGDQATVYVAAWDVGRLLPLAATIALCWQLRREQHAVDPKSNAPPTRMPAPEVVFLLVAAAAVFGLVQVPLAHGIYFLYAAAPALVATAAVLSMQFPQTRMPIAILAGGTTLFLASWVLPAYHATFGVRYIPGQDRIRIAAERCPTACDPLTAAQLTEVIEEVGRLTKEGATILAFPDSPDVYFMTGRRNPTRTMFDAFDDDYGTPERDRRLLETIEKNQIDVVVVRNRVEFSLEGLSPALAEELKRRFPHVKILTGGPMSRFTLLWRDRGVAAQPALPALAGK